MSIFVTRHVPPTPLDHLLGKLVIGLVSCNLVQSQMHDEHLNPLSTHPIVMDSGYDRTKFSMIRMILDSLARLHVIAESTERI